jgi:hypothetical protein
MDQPQFCYALTTTGRDLFADMTYASAAFLRHTYPESEIVCLCDALSHRALEAARHPLLELVDRAVAVETPDGPPGYRNRSVKTRMRQVLEGDFVYFDSDTLVVDRIDELLACQAPVAGVVDEHHSSRSLRAMAFDRVAFQLIGWQMPSRSHINGGVLVLRDREPTHRFARLWHEKWLAWSRRGRHTDQQSLNSALADCGVDYEVLGSRFNAQVHVRPRLCLEPVAVWHFSCSHGSRNGMAIPRTMLDEAIARFRAEGCLSPAVIRELRQWPYPWHTPTMLDRWFVRHHVLSKDDLPEHSASRYWLAGHRRKAVMTALLWHLGTLADAAGKRATMRGIIRPALRPARRLIGAICLVYDGGIGDHLMLSTVARELKRRGQRRVFVVTPYPELFLHNADIDGAATPGTNRSRLIRLASERTLWPTYFTYLINHDPAADTRDPPPEPVLAYLCRLAGVTGWVALRTYITLSESEHACGASYQGCIAIQSSGLGAGVAALNKEWFPERFAEVAAHLLGSHPVVQVGLATDPPIPCTYDLRGRLSLRELAAVLAHCRMFIGLEGMPMHMARAVDCPSVIVYGGRLRPDQVGYICNENLYIPVMCSPCWRDSRCDLGRACLESITARDVIAAAQRLLGRPREGLEVESYEIALGEADGLGGGDGAERIRDEYHGVGVDEIEHRLLGGGAAGVGGQEAR